MPQPLHPRPVMIRMGSNDHAPRYSYINTDHSNTNKLRVTNINFQSIINKKADLLDFIYTYKPSIIIGTETWLSASVSNNEIIPDKWNYVIYRKDRSDNYGGVLIAISKQIPSYEVSSLQTDCELLWVQITINRGIKLYIGAYYRVHIDDQYSI